MRPQPKSFACRGTNGIRANDIAERAATREEGDLELASAQRPSTQTDPAQDGERRASRAGEFDLDQGLFEQVAVDSEALERGALPPCSAARIEVTRPRVKRDSSSALIELPQVAIPELVRLATGAARVPHALLDPHRSLDLAALARAGPAHWTTLGLTPAAAARLVAAFELGRRVEQCRRPVRTAVISPAVVHELLAPEVRGLEQETFHVLLLDTKHRLRRRFEITRGTLTSSLVHPREVFREALRECAAGVLVAHNHPSGDPEPSDEDFAVTKRLLEAARVLGIALVDHVVVADAGYVSLRDRMEFATS